jgi:hypothetical protein
LKEKKNKDKWYEELQKHFSQNKILNNKLPWKTLRQKLFLEEVLLVQFCWLKEKRQNNFSQ